MNPPDRTDHANGHPPASGLNFDDVCFTVFRHQWLILACTLLGIVGAALVWIMRPPLYVSRAKLMLPYVVDPATKSPSSDATVTSTDPGGQNILNSELEILTSLDVATNAARLIGPAKILAKRGGGKDLLAAASVICSGVDVKNPPQTTILTISLKLPDAAVVQPALEALIQTYTSKHLEVRMGVGVLDKYFAQQRDEYRKRLAVEEAELKQLKAKGGVLFPEDTRHSYQTDINKAREDLLLAQRELVENKAMQATLTAPGTTNADQARIPAAVVDDYRTVTAGLEDLKRRERVLRFEQQYKEAHPAVQTLRQQMASLTKEKADLERRYPSLAHLPMNPAGNTNATRSDLTAEWADLRQLAARVTARAAVLSNLQQEASLVLDLEPKIMELQRLHDEDQKSYDFALSRLDQTRVGASRADGRMVNISVVQNPTPPGRDYGKVTKLIGLVLAGFIGLGVGLAFALDLAIDRTIRRQVDIERHLRLPVFLIIPDTNWTGRLGLPWLRNWCRKLKAVASQTANNGQTPAEMALAPWRPEHQLQTYTDGLRERLLTFFEINHMNLKKPKMVAVTGCGNGTGVSTLASGLAASLSKIGDGNVLLVNINGKQAAQAFHKGKPSCTLSDALEPSGRAEALVQENLYVATVQDSDNNDTNDKLAKIVPFYHLVPKLKASDYDYIIFDMPAISQTSATPRLANHMDIVLMVLESEKTGQQTARRASALMRESRTPVAAVLNKYRPYVPARLAQDL